MSDSKFEAMESGLNSADNTMLAVTVGGAAVGLAANKVVPRRIRSRIRRQRSALRKRVDGCQQKFPRLFWFGNFCLAGINLGLYFLDIYTDVVLCITFYRYKHLNWFYIMAACIACPYVVALVGIAIYLRKEGGFGIDWDLLNRKPRRWEKKKKKKEYRKKVMLFSSAPIWFPISPSMIF